MGSGCVQYSHLRRVVRPYLGGTFVGEVVPVERMGCALVLPETGARPWVGREMLSCRIRTYGPPSAGRLALPHIRK